MGDLPGHDFRGNQHEKAEGGATVSKGDYLTSARPMPSLPSEYSPASSPDADVAWTRMAAAQNSQELGRAYRSLVKDADEGKVKVSDGALSFLKGEAAKAFAGRGPARSAEDVRADRVLKITDSSGRSRGRRSF
jgi:hypothetical protein